MENLSREQLNTLSKDALVEMVLSLSNQVKDLNKKMDLMLEQMAIMNNARFGRQTEKVDIDGNQLSFFNEIEANADESVPEEDITEIVPSYKRKKSKGKRKDDLSGFPVRVVMHEIPEDELKELFPNGYTRLPDETYTKLNFIPASYEVLEHHRCVYKSNDDERIVKAPHPTDMLEKSIATPSLVSAILNAKYTNALPLYRIEKEFERNDIHISRQTMSNWVITVAERYLSLVYDRMKKELLTSRVIHADETPLLVTKDGREGMHKNYMWVYRNGSMCNANDVVVYDYQRSRKQSAPLEFLSGYKGVLITDGYEVYHGIEKRKSDEIQVAGCWIHAKRKFSNVTKAKKSPNGEERLSGKIVAKISQIFHEDNKLDLLSAEERLHKRQEKIKPFVDEFFDFIKSESSNVLPDSETGKGIKYCLNQEQYLRRFIDDPEIPMDNNAAEQAIRSFTIGRNNWKVIDTINGANASAMLYSIVETAKANELKIYDYFSYLLTEIPKHMDDTTLDFLESLLPWSDSLPKGIHKKN